MQASADLMEGLVVREVPVTSCLAGISHALHQCMAVGVFNCPAVEMELPVAEWKKDAWHRLVHTMGLTHVFSNRKALRQSLETAPWKPLDELHHSAQTFLPPGTCHVAIDPSWSAKMVSKLGHNLSHLIDWEAIALHLGRPDLALVLLDAAYHSKWRRAPRGTGQGPPFLTATHARTGGVISALGAHLAEATVTLVLRGMHLDVARHAN